MCAPGECFADDCLTVMKSAAAELNDWPRPLQPVIYPCAGSRQRSCSAYSCIKAKPESAGRRLATTLQTLRLKFAAPSEQTCRACTGSPGFWRHSERSAF